MWCSSIEASAQIDRISVPSKQQGPCSDTQPLFCHMAATAGSGWLIAGSKPHEMVLCDGITHR